MGIPVNPPKRPLSSRAKLAKTLKRSRVAATIRPRPRSSPRSSFAPDSNASLYKEASFVGSGFLPTAHSTFSVRTSQPSTYRQTLPSRLRNRVDAVLPPHRRYLCGLTRAICIFLFVVLALIIALALGLGLGLSLRGKTRDTSSLPFPDGSRRTYDGELTHFAPALGACGINNTEGDSICAVAWELFDAAGPNVRSHAG
jgi:hypothetical protein